MGAHEVWGKSLDRFQWILEKSEVVAEVEGDPDGFTAEVIEKLELLIDAPVLVILNGKLHAVF